LVIASIFSLLSITFIDAQPLPERRALRGRVMGDNKLPIGGAAVTVRRVGTGSAGFWGTVVYSDARGDFVVPEVEEGTYSVAIEAKNFARLDAKPYTVTASGTPLEAVLQRLAIFTLRIQGSDGETVAQTPVSVLMHHSTHGSRVFRMNSDAKGEITLSGLTPARYRLYAVAKGRGFDTVEGIELSPGTNLETVNLALKPGGTLQLTAHETPKEETPNEATSPRGRALGGAALTLSVKLPDAPNSPLNLASLYADERTTVITRDTDGTLELTDVPPGLYSAILAQKSYEGTPREITIKAQETTTTDFWLLRAVDAQMSSLRVLVQDAKAQPLANASVSVTLEQLSGAVDVNQAAIVGVTQRRARTDEKGQFDLYPLAVGNWRVRLRATTSDEGAGKENKVFVATELHVVKLGVEGSAITIHVK
jgi:hypothetical protein